MTFRSKLILTMAPLALALAAVAIISGAVAAILAQEPAHIWKDNYRSILAGERMKENIERINDAARLELLGVADAARSFQPNLDQFDRELMAEAENITEPGESEAVESLRAHWANYKRTLDAFRTATDLDSRRAICLGPLAKAFVDVRSSADSILAINQDAMVHKGQRAERRGARFERILILAVILASLLGLLASVSLTARLLRPLGIVSAAVRRFGQGDLQARARVEGKDEIAQLAREFNTMADHLERYRKSSLGELLQAHQASQAAIDSLPDPVLMLDGSGKLQGTNQAARKRLSIDPEHKYGRALDDLDPGIRALLDRLRMHVVAGRGAYTPKGFEDSLRVSTPEGECIYLPRATPIYGEYGSVAGAALVLQDITRLFQFDELKNNLVATVAHEFRTPLTSLRMAIHLCTEEAVGPLTAKQADLLFAARDDCERLQGIVDDLLNLSRIESGRIELQKRRIEPQTLVELALDVHKTAAEAKQLSLRAEVYPGLPEVFADPDRIQLIFANLLTNAIRYSPAQAEVLVRASLATEQSGDVDRSASTFIRFEVSDHGPGVPSEHQAALFEKFFRVPGSPSGGAGLGLFIARGIAQAHGGRIGLASQEGPGATFWFTIPAAPELSPQG
jgi:two-component system, NtrC family, sensor histidine kinase KinB